MYSGKTSVADSIESHRDAVGLAFLLYRLSKENFNVNLKSPVFAGGNVVTAMPIFVIWASMGSCRM